MEVERLIFALEETISCLKKSRSSDWSPMSVEEIIRRLDIELAKAKNSKPVDVNFLDHLFAPTGVIQEISMESGWGTKFLRISEVIDRFIVN
jgi:hypothetical protein